MPAGGSCRTQSPQSHKWCQSQGGPVGGNTVVTLVSSLLGLPVSVSTIAIQNMNMNYLFKTIYLSFYDSRLKIECVVVAFNLFVLCGQKLYVKSRNTVCSKLAYKDKGNINAGKEIISWKCMSIVGGSSIGKIGPRTFAFATLSISYVFL